MGTRLALSSYTYCTGAIGVKRSTRALAMVSEHTLCCDRDSGGKRSSTYMSVTTYSGRLSIIEVLRVWFEVLLSNCARCSEYARTAFVSNCSLLICMHLKNCWALYVSQAIQFALLSL